MRSKYFILGFNDYRNSKPFREIVDRNKSFQFNYERGRHFAAACPEIDRVKDGKTITYEALDACYSCFLNKEMI